MDNDNDFKDVKLRVKDALKDDVARGIARIDPMVIKELNLRNGNIVQIYHPTSEKKTAAILFPGKAEDKGNKIIRMDPSLRRNLDASINDIVMIRKIDAGEAERVTFAGLEETVILRNSQQLAKKLENRVITKGDILSFYSMGRRVDIVVTNFFPKSEAVRIHLDTKIILSEKSQKQIIESEKAKVTYEDIGGLKKQIQEINELITLPLNHPELFKRLGKYPPKYIIFSGPSGTGKTLLSKAIAYETKVHFINLDLTEIISKFHGQSEKNLKHVFEEAKENSPSIICIDDIELFCPKESVIHEHIERTTFNQLLLSLDEANTIKDLFVIGITNKIEEIHRSLLSSGRFSKILQFNLPLEEERFDILKIHVKKMPIKEDLDLKIIAKRTNGFSGADIEALLQEAMMLAVRENLPKFDLLKPIPPKILNNIYIGMDHFLTAISQIEQKINLLKD